MSRPPRAVRVALSLLGAGLAGAPIIAVCDAYDAMVSDRSYRRALPPEHALEKLRRCAGTQFDPDVVRAFATTLARAGRDVGAAA